MKVVELYILRRTLGIFTATLFWVLAIVWTTQILTRINVVTGNGQSAATFFEIAWLVLPAVIPVVIPFAVGIAVAQTLTTMNTDSELIVISAAGSPRMTVMRPILLLAVGACIISFTVNNFIEPYSRERLRVLVSEARAELITTVIQEGTFQEIEDGLHMQIGERLPDGRFGGIFVSDRREEGTELLYYAKSGATLELNGEHLLVMQDGVVHRKTGDGVSVVQYTSYALDLSQFAASGAGPTLLPKDRTLGYLMNPDRDDPIFKKSPQGFRAELHKRFTEWLYPLVFALIALAVAGDSRSFREARIHPLLTTMTIALVFRWAGFFAADKVWNVPAFTPMVYGVPIVACAVAIFFIATNRVMELPMSIVERATTLWNRLQQRIVALKIRLSGFRRTAPGGSA
ncbi:LPS export ABC transporter permease LptF [Mesorhizobium microcysteis]|uniref:LPS export ABC transporter permease LptF n=1 Tax=Neoaquamicrobium microcysteis TaxID=2682781 RepID=A0A5D4H208_9HYPH|nr:LPS export ABC transporter permease LptF [Mesorhizobium microcysteis]TYR32820.1 LPS export ABC transporter permease LptF [Mesorhizobium microcysteis]